MLPSLPDPILLDDVLSELRSNLSANPHAMLGEVGLDRAARVPYDYRSAQRKLSPFTIPLEHQLVIVAAQIDVAVELQRNISFHSVKSQKHTVDLLSAMKKKHGSRWSSVSIDMHSCGLSVETWKEVEVRGCNAYFITLHELSIRFTEITCECIPFFIHMYQLTQSCSQITAGSSVRKSDPSRVRLPRY